jgi:hypothetical protein
MMILVYYNSLISNMLRACCFEMLDDEHFTQNRNVLFIAFGHQEPRGQVR